MMAKLEYPIKSVNDAFSISPTDSVEDPEIIKHIADTYGFRGVWITKDNSANRLLKNSEVYSGLKAGRR